MSLNKHNLRSTPQRLAVVKYLKSVTTHPTAEMVFNNIKKRIPDISRATVYNNLNTLADEGMISRLEINKEYHFDADMSAHSHFICNECGKVFDVMNPKPSIYAMKHFDEKELEAKSVSIFYRGICKDCKDNHFVIFKE